MSRPLAAAVAPGSDLYRYFFPHTPTASPSSPRKKGIATVASQRAAAKQQLVALEPLNRRLVVVVEGAGDWVEKTYRPMFRGLVESGKPVSVFYADDTRWRTRPAWTSALEPWEVYLDKADPVQGARYRMLRPDATFVVTPDFTHAEIARGWIGRSPLVLVEKPFDSELGNVRWLLQELGTQRLTAVVGLDHYQFYARPLLDTMPTVMNHLGGAVACAFFSLTERNPIERGRERSLQHGLTLDLLPHFLAILSYLGDIATVDDIRVLAAGQYRPLISRDETDDALTENIEGWFRNETYARVRFTFEDHSGSGYRVPCVGLVAKGAAQTAKYVELWGRNGNAVRLDLNKPPQGTHAPAYPWGTLFFLHGADGELPDGAAIREMVDPYDGARTLRVIVDISDSSRFERPLDRGRYRKLVHDLVDGSRDGIVSVLLLKEAAPLVAVLDRVWQALQRSKTAWRDHQLHELLPLSIEETVFTREQRHDPQEG